MEPLHRVLRALIIGSAAALLSSCGGSSSVGITPGSSNDIVHQKSGSETFDYTGTEQQFVVPHGVTQLQVVAIGAAGAGSRGASDLREGGATLKHRIIVAGGGGGQGYQEGSGGGAGGRGGALSGGSRKAGCCKRNRNNGYGGTGGTESQGGSGGGGGGGGGSSYAEPSATSVHMSSGWKKATDNGLVVITWR